MTKKDTRKKRSEKRKKKPFFERLGVFVTEKYKLILIIWVIVLGGAVYPALKLSGVLSYNELEFLPDNLEFHKGGEIFDELFPSNATGTTIIVLQSDILISSQENMDYISELTNRIYRDYGDSIYEIQSAVTVLEGYNDTYWDMVSTGRTILNSTINAQINNTNQAMYISKAEIEAIWDQIAGLYLTTWFNVSRTYYYGVYNTSLFESGTSPVVYQKIAELTNFTTDMSITPEYVDLVYSTIISSLPNPYAVNDSVMNNLTLNLVNSTLYNYLSLSEGMTYQTYLSEVYPLLSLYHRNWTQTLETDLTALDVSIVNGTDFSSNMYDNSTLPNAFASQGMVLSQLSVLNDTAFASLNVRGLIINNTLALIDISELIEDFASDLPVSQTTIENALNPLVPPFIADIYDLGSNPTVEEINTLTTNFVEEVIAVFINIYPPAETIDDVSGLFTQWVLSSDGKTSLILVTYNEFNKTLDEIDAMVKEADLGIGDLAHELAEEMDLQNTRVYHTGDEYVTTIWISQAEEDTKLIDIFTIVFVVVILLIVFTSFIAPLIPLIAIGSSIVTSMAILWFVSFGMDIHFLATLFLTITSLGAGIDYCIFIFSRYNEERKKGRTKKPALIIAMKYAGESVFHSGLTVIVGFGAMIIPNFPLLRILGVAMCIGIIMSMASALVVVPSIIMLLGEVIWWPKILQVIFRPQKWFKKQSDAQANGLIDVPDGTPTYVAKEDEPVSKKKKSFMVRFSNFITKRGVAITVLTFVIATPFLYFTFTMDTSTDFMGMLPGDFEGTVGRNILSDSMSVGDPIAIKLLIYDLQESPLEYDVRVETEFLNFYLLQLEHVSTIRTTVRPLGLAMIDAIEGPFASYSRSFVGTDNRSLLLEIYLDVSPYHKEAELLVGELPDTVAGILEDRNLESLGEGKIFVLGYARALYEIKEVTDNAMPIVIAVVIVGVYLVLFVLFGSYFTPIRLIITIALSIGVTLGLLQLVYSVGFNVPIFWLLPIMLFSILMGLGMDYDIFLVTRIKEYYDKGMSNKEAIAHALDHTASIITSCGTVMAAAYSSLLISKLWHLRELGFAFTVAIILDATVIRLIVVPAMMVLMEKLNWIGPKWLMKKRHASADLTEITGEEISDVPEETDESNKD